MFTKIATLLLFVLIQTFTGTAQDFHEKFNALSEKKDLKGQEALLENWAKASPADPELFIAYFNYYVRKSKSEFISLDNQQRSPQALALTDTGSGKPAGFLNFSTQYDSKWLSKGFEEIEKGISLHPTRLDMRFGKIYMLGEAENYKAFTQELVKTIHYGPSIKHQWLWKHAKSLEDPQEFFLGTVQSYIRTLYDTEDDALLPLMRDISEAVLQHFPSHVESLSNIALTYLVTGAYDKALPNLLKAETISPKDVIVLNNIAQAYKRMGDKAKAKMYFEKVIKYGDEDNRAEAKENIKKLN